MVITNICVCLVPLYSAWGFIIYNIFLGELSIYHQSKGCVGGPVLGQEGHVVGHDEVLHQVIRIRDRVKTIAQTKVLHHGLPGVPTLVHQHVDHWDLRRFQNLILDFLI